MNAIEVLLVEDDIADVELVKSAMKKSKFVIQMKHVFDGEECLQYLRKEGEFKDVPTPDLVLLDLNMPKKDGREVLAEVKQDPTLKQIPIVILTTSEADTDIAKTYNLGVNCYITKPVDFEQFKIIVDQIANFWFSVVKLPDGVEHKIERLN